MNTHALVYWFDESNEATVMEVGTLIECRKQFKNMVDWWFWFDKLLSDEPYYEKMNYMMGDYYFTTDGEHWEIIQLQSGAVSVGDTVPIPK